MKKRFMRILLCLVLAISLVPAAALAAPTDYKVWVNGEQFTSEHLTIACGSGTASYDPAARNITLNGASITPGGPGPEGYGLYIEGDGSGQKTTVTLTGENSITAFGTFGIYSETELEVTGGGSFTMEHVSNGIVSLKGVCVSGTGTQVVVRDGTNSGINALSGAVQVNGAKVTIGAKTPIKAVDMIVSQGALLDVTQSGEGDYAVYIAKDATGAGSGNIRIADNSTVSVKSEKSGVLAMGITAAGGKLTVQANEFGAMCMAYSGRCIISSYLAGRSGNRGLCAQPCRWNYVLLEEKRPGEYIPIEENDAGTQILSSHDLCMIDYVKQLETAGVCSFKIEGRMKSAYYTATVTNAYRRAIDETAGLDFCRGELSSIRHRPYSTGFYFRELAQNHAHDPADQFECVFAAKVLSCENGTTTIQQRGNFAVGDVLETIAREGETKKIPVTALIDESEQAQPNAPHPMQVLKMPCDCVLTTGEFLRKRVEK